MVSDGAAADEIMGMREQLADSRRAYRTGIIAILLCIAVGIANIFHFSVIIIFSVICL